MAALAMKAAWASVDITPRQPVPMAGYSMRTEPFTAIHDRLEANGVLLAHAGRRLFLVSLDLLYAGPLVTRFIEQALAARGIDPDDIFVTASHSHFAPATDPGIAALGRVNEGYIEHLLDRLAGLVDQVLSSRPVEVIICRRKLRLPLCVNRRRQWPLAVRRRALGINVVVNAPNARGRRDESADLLVVSRLDGTPVALVWRYACHPVSFPLATCISAEYPGVVRDAVRRRVGTGLPVLFWQGFAGDIRPTLRAAPSIKGVLGTLVRGPRFGSVSMSAWSAWSQQMADAVVDGMRFRAEAMPRQTPLGTSSYAVPASRFISGGPGEKALRVQRLSLGSSLTVLFASAEVVAEHADALVVLGGNAIGVGYAGDVFGYLPTDEQVNQGGYEATDWLLLFGIGEGYRESLDALWREVLLAVADCAPTGEDRPTGGG
jgi:hypothetical protein